MYISQPHNSHSSPTSCPESTCSYVHAAEKRGPWCTRGHPCIAVIFHCLPMARCRARSWTGIVIFSVSHSSTIIRRLVCRNSRIRERLPGATNLRTHSQRWSNSRKKTLNSDSSNTFAIDSDSVKKKKKKRNNDSKFWDQFYFFFSCLRMEFGNQ